MTDPRLDSLTIMAITGAEQLDDDELDDRLAELLDQVAVQTDTGEFIQDLRELAAVCLTTAQRIETRR